MVLVKNNKEIHGINSEKDIIKLFVDLSNKITECANTLAQYYKNVKDSEDDYQRDPDDEYYKRTLNDRKHAKKRSEEEFKKYLNSLYNNISVSLTCYLLCNTLYYHNPTTSIIFTHINDGCYKFFPKQILIQFILTENIVPNTINTINIPNTNWVWTNSENYKIDNNSVNDIHSELYNIYMKSEIKILIDKLKDNIKNILPDYKLDMFL